MPEQNTDRPLFADEVQNGVGAVELYTPPTQPGRELIIDGQPYTTYFDDQGVEMVRPVAEERGVTRAYVRVETESGLEIEATHTGVATDRDVAALSAVVAAISTSATDQRSGPKSLGRMSRGSSSNPTNGTTDSSGTFADRLGNINKFSVSKKVIAGLALAFIFSNTYSWTRLGGQDFIEFEEWRNPEAALAEPIMWGEAVWSVGKFVIKKATN